MASFSVKCASLSGQIISFALKDFGVCSIRIIPYMPIVCAKKIVVRIQWPYTNVGGSAWPVIFSCKSGDRPFLAIALICHMNVVDYLVIVLSLW